MQRVKRKRNLIGKTKNYENLRPQNRFAIITSQIVYAVNTDKRC